jgi:hypothetical protein
MAPAVVTRQFADPDRPDRREVAGRIQTSAAGEREDLLAQVLLEEIQRAVCAEAQAALFMLRSRS